MTYRNILHKGCVAACLMGAMFSAVSCNDEMVSPEMEEKVLISDINLDVTPILPLLVGSDTILKYSVLPDNASDKGVIWKSGSPEIAKVDEDGRITAVHAGTAIVSVMPAIGFAVTSTVEIKVVDEIVFVEDIELDMDELEVHATASLQLKWITTPSEPTYPTLKWESLTPDIATVTEGGLVKGVAEGTARIKATATDDRHFSKEFEITVKPMIFVESLEFVKESDELALGEVYVPQLNVQPSNATLSALKWESSKPEVVEVDEDGHFIAKKYGNAVITAKADYGDGNPISASMNVIVSEGKMNDSFEFMNSWENFNGQCLEFNWLEDQGILSLFPGADKNYKAIRIKRTGGFEFNV
ncbi:Ig-like domain-containing protein, partial [uncultured Bacteroides sp.]|uniref:Ig-like domain-containing protein n=1 Tax=uncultured Bacteroides sp. TaxID=162156 RepID=UPI0025E1A6EA